MKIETIAFLIPCHPPHYHYIYDLIHKCNDNDIKIDIHVVFSSKHDYELFTLKSDIQPLILDESVKTKSIITYKKFFGLEQLMHSKYEYILCCDSEIDIVPQNFTTEGIHHKIRQIFERKQIYAGKTADEFTNTIAKTSASVFRREFPLLRKLTN
jgi:hypothetical protein